MNKLIKCPECNQMKPTKVFQSGLGLIDAFIPTQWGSEICGKCFNDLMLEDNSEEIAEFEDSIIFQSERSRFVEVDF